MNEINNQAAGNEYLWDASGEPDSEIVRLERTLAVLRFKPQPLPDVPVSAVEPPRRRFVWLTPVCAAVATLLLMAVLWNHWRLRWTPDAPWRVSAVEGSPLVDGQAIRGKGELRVGQTLQTDTSSQAQIRVARIGVIDVRPGSRLELLSTGERRHRVALQHGKIDARLWAPPFSLGVRTPSAQVFDLGCAFSLETDGGGAGVLRVTSGWVALEMDLESGYFQTLVPAGAQSEIRADSPPGVPYVPGASEPFRKALRELNFLPLTAEQRASDLRTVLLEARERDVLTLFNLIERANREERALLYDRAAELSPPPAGVTREGVLARSQPMLDRWWHGLGYGNAKRWWVNWKDLF